MRHRKTLAMAFGTLLVAGAVVADDMWLKNNAIVHSDASPAAEKVVDALKGTKVQQVAKQGNWAKIQMNGKTGWIAASSLSLREIKPDSGAFGGLASAQSSSAAAAKGLEPMALQFAQNTHLSDEGLKQMEDIKKTVTPQMLQDFMMEGHVGTR